MANRLNIDVKDSRPLSFSESMVSLVFRALPIKHGKHRLLDHLANKAWDRSGRSVTTSINGQKVIIDPYDLVGWHFAMLRSFDPEVVEILKKACNPAIKEVFWDIGANKGACFCSLAVELPLLQIVAIEPQAKLLANNITNLESVCPRRYEYVQAGIGEEEAELTLVIPNANLGRASLHIQCANPEDDTEVIKILTASQIEKSSKFGWPTIIKIDVEGHEPHVFRSLEPCIASRVCKVIVFENHASETNAFDTVRALTEPHGYQIYGIRKSLWSTSLVHTKEQLLQVTDYAVIRSDLVTENQQISNLVK